MDGNKDDARKCLKIGKEALESGDRARALKFVAKARRLDPNLQVDDLLAKIEGQSDSQSESTNNGEGPAPDRSGAAQSDQRKPSSVRHRGPSSSSASSGGVSYTEEQITMVRQIRKKKDFYEILGVERSCSVEDVRKAYRKLSLKVHPDKNKAPGAEEAFKAVSKAFQCLSDEESRKKYDVTGSDEPVHMAQAARRGPAQGFTGFYEAEFDADEIFRNFFFGGMHPATTQYRGFSFGTGMGARQAADNGSSGFNMRMLIQLLPVILILLLNFLPSSDPIYSLSRTYPYEYKYTTQRGVNYYVKSTSKFDQDYPPDSHERARLEVKIDRDYISILAQNCRVEMQRRQWGFIKEMPHCDMLQKFEGVA
ncbi:hypothetical protein BT93_C0696 [Corymbia citriodora subsp. variegata]|nr:hypothetical protein BT93_C0696 [Corymbia citriodora subsp. variegata]KAF8034465.1 hypothetical protein BT93_C0696 [Corymbia citriodora subsp. variegata]